MASEINCMNNETNEDTGPDETAREQTEDRRVTETSTDVASQSDNSDAQSKITINVDAAEPQILPFNAMHPLPCQNKVPTLPTMQVEI